MGELVLGVVMDVLGHVRVEYGQRLGERLVAAAARHLAILDPAQLVVLLPQVGLENLGRGQEPQDRRIALTEVALGERRSDPQPTRSEHAGSEHPGSGAGDERPSAGQRPLRRGLR